jgi:hypothetical protein
MLPVIGPLLGLTFAWISTQWTRTEKLVATGFVFALLVLPVLLVTFARSA